MKDLKTHSRLFIAIPLDSFYLSFCEEFIINQQLSGVKWVPLQNLHITGVFLGDFPDETIPRLKDSLALI